MGKNDIDKLNEQIESLTVKEHSMNGVVIENNSNDDNLEKTKKLENIDNVEQLEEEKTKKIENIENNEIKEENVIKTDDKKNNNKSKLIITIIISIVFILCILFIILIIDPFKKNDSTNNVVKNEEKTINEKEIINGYGDALKAVININYEKENKLLNYDEAIKLVNYDYKIICNVHEIYDDGSIYLNNCSIDGKNTKYSYGTKQEKKEEPIISEDSIKVYVSKNDSKATLNKPENEDDYDIYYFDIDGKYTGLELLDSLSDYIFYLDEEYNSHIINFKTGNKIFENINYSSVLPIKINNVYDLNYVALCINDKWGFYKISNNERVVAHKYDDVAPSLSMGISGPASYINALDGEKIAVCNYGVNNSECGVIDYHNGKEIIPVEYKRFLKSGSYLWGVDNSNDGHIFDYDGVEYLNKKYDTVYWIVDGKYILVKEEDNTKLVSIKGKEIYDYGKLEIGKINYGLNYKEGALFQFDNPNSTNVEEGCIEVIYDAASKTGEVKTSYCGGIAKPVLYLYPKKTTKVSVSFMHPEYLETTYPKFNGKWEVIAHKNGDLYDNNDKYYYALYWDEKRIHEVDFSTGYYVEKDNAIEFLEQKLSYIGLSPKERNEFIMYWLPVLEKNGKNLVYFELTEERESYNKININPKPDSLLRLVIHIKKVNEKQEIKKQSLIKFQRKGFVAVEWGGINY